MRAVHSLLGAALVMGIGIFSHAAGVSLFGGGIFSGLGFLVLSVLIWVELTAVTM